MWGDRCWWGCVLLRHGLHPQSVPLRVGHRHENVALREGVALVRERHRAGGPEDDPRTDGEAVEVGDVERCGRLLLTEKR